MAVRFTTCERLSLCPASYETHRACASRQHDVPAQKCFRLQEYLTDETRREWTDFKKAGKQSK